MLIIISASLICLGALDSWLNRKHEGASVPKASAGGALMLIGLLILGAAMPLSHRGNLIDRDLSAGQQRSGEIRPLAS